jgi:perosamine synthetase
MAVTGAEGLAARMRMNSLHGLTQDPWGRSAGESWDYRIVSPGFKYNLTDVAAAIGIHQLERAEQMRLSRERIAALYDAAFRGVEEIDTPPMPANRLHAWHLYPIRLRLDALAIDRNTFISALRAAGIGCSVHWRPLHLHPYYQDTFGWSANDCPVASREWERLISLPLFPSMTDEEIAAVTTTVTDVCRRHRVNAVALPVR